MTEKDVFILSDEAMVRVVEQIKDGQWDMDMPETFRRKDKAPVSLRKILNYHAYDDAWVPDILAGKTMDEAGKEKFDGDLLGSTPKENFKAIADKAIAAAKDADLTRTAHLTYGDFPASEYFKHITLFRTLRAYDLAKVIGIDPTLKPELVQGLFDEVAPHADAWRKMGVFGPEVPVAEDAPLMQRLLGLTGRQPE